MGKVLQEDSFVDCYGTEDISKTSMILISCHQEL